MEITVVGKHLDITDAIREYAVEKVGRLPRYFDRITQIEVLASRPDNWSFELEVIVHAERTDPFIARTNGEDLYACIDLAVAKLERQLHDHKERLRNRKHSA